MIIGLLLASSLVTPSVEKRYETSFREAGVYSNGPANVAPVMGGEYAYGPSQADPRAATKPVMLGANKRTDFTFFTPDEEKALLELRNKQVRAVVRDRLRQQRGRHLSRRLNLDWPKVVVTDTEICVPELASSESADWKNHLICHKKGD